MKYLPSAAALGALLLTIGAEPARGALAYGLTGTGVVTFDTDNPAVFVSSAFTGLLAGDNIVDIDYRPANGALYALASNGRIYTLGAGGALTVDTSAAVGQLGTVADIDFNPVADRIRISSAGDANYRVTQGTGAVTIDGTFAYAGGDANAGANPNLVGAAYTNSIMGAATTSLYTLDADLDILTLHSGGPQFSTLNTVGELTIGGLLTLDIGPNVGFDILSSGGTDTAYFSNGDFIYQLDLATAEAIPLGAVGGGAGGPGIFSLAVVPEPGSALLLGLASSLFIRRRRA